MKTIQRFVFLFSAATIFLSSCSIEKRHYRSGYHIEWKHKVKTAAEPAEKADEEININTISPIPVLEKKHVNPVAKDQQGITASVPAEKKKHGADIILPVKNTASAKKPVHRFNGKPFFAHPVQHLTVKKKISFLGTPKISNTAMSDDARLIFGIIFLIFGLSPFAILVYVGPGGEFTLDAVLWIAGLVLLLIGLGASSGLAAIGWILLAVAWIYAIIVMIRHAI